MRTRPAFVCVVAVAVAFAVASCGARSGLHGGPWGSGDGGDGGDGLASGDGGAEGGVPCVPGVFPLERGTAKVILVVDRSGSMHFALDTSEPPPPGVPTRWDALRQAILQTVAPFDDEIAFGATFFPSTSEQGGGCGIESSDTITPSLGNGAAVLGAIDGTEPFGGTPTAVAIRASADVLSKERGAVRALVVATDGAPNCNRRLDPRACTCTSTGDVGTCGNAGNGETCLDDARTVSTVEAVATKDRIPVFVLGIGDDGAGAVFTATLDAMAIAGGRPRDASPRFYPAKSPGELGAALATIRDGVARCTYLTPSAPPEPPPDGAPAHDDIEVRVDGVLVPRDVTRRDGWDWVDQAYGQLAFFGRACERTSSGAVSALVRCGR